MRTVTRLAVAILVVLAGALTFAGALAQEETAPEPATRSTVEIFVEANTAYEEADYDAAIDGYEQLLAGGLDSSALYYNLGNAQLRSGELGRAVASYRRARARAPRDEDVLANLAFARQSRRDDLAPPEPSATLETLLFWHYRTSPRERWGVLLALNAGLWSFALLGVWRRRWPEWLRWSLLVTGVPLLALGASLVFEAVDRTSVAVVVPAEVEALGDSVETAALRFVLHSGSEVRVTGDRGSWTRIELPDGQQGWIEDHHLEIVRR